MEQWLLDLGVEVETVEVELWVACVVVVEEVTMIDSAVVVYDGVGDRDDRDDDYYYGGDVMDKSSSMVSSTVLAAAAVVHLFPMVQSHCHRHCYCGHCCHSCQTMIS